MSMAIEPNPGQDEPRFTCEPDPANPGWMRWDVLDQTRYNHVFIGPMLVRRESGSICRVRIDICPRHTNAGGTVHGGTTLGFADVSMFAALYVLTGVDPLGATTVDLSMQFVGAGSPRRPMDSVVELLRETSRLAFLRGTMVQGERLIAAFSGTARKPSQRPA
jgi:acyl-coenzyme A thioesterase PaaI-like protein